MGNRIENLLLNFIKKNTEYIDYDTEEIIRYGFQVLYFNLSKLIIVVIVAYFFRIIKETFLVILVLSVAKMFSFGFHAKDFIGCILITFVNIFGIIYISKVVHLSVDMKGYLCIFAFTLFLIFAPADSEERPIVSAKKRKKYKIFSLIVCKILCYIALGTETFLSNIIVFSLVVVAINTTPILYIIFGRRYRNYETIT